MGDTVATSFRTLNYSGMLFNKGNTKTPLSSIIGSRAKSTNHVEFVIGQEYTGGGDGEQPEISEDASLTAPDATIVTRDQMTNVTQIFMESVKVSYGKMSNMGTLSGANIAGQQANPMNELDFQVGAKMQKVKRDIEYTFINGVYQKAANDQTANKTRGLISAITTSVMDMDHKAMGLWDIAEMLRAMYGVNAPISDLVLWCDPVTMFQINADAVQNNLTIVSADRTINGISLDSVITPLGRVYLRLGECLPAGTAMLLNLGVIAPVYQPVPGKGNFFLEQLAKVGAGDKYQLFGQLGLDHGPEWYHAKFTNINTGFEKPKYQKSVMIAGGTVGSVSVKANLLTASLNKTQVDASNEATVAVANVTYDIEPAESPSLSYLWQIRAKTGTQWNDLTASYTGYNSQTLTVQAVDAQKHYRCKVTASGTAVGTAYSNECDVKAA